jgi:hypothetical protein
MTSGPECWRTPGEGERAGSGDSGHGPRFRTDTPYPARACHYRLLDGKDHHPAGREPAEDLTRLRPETGPTAPANRYFLARAVHHFAGRGIRQFLHIGTPLPAPGSTHDIAQREAPDCRIVYAGNGPLAGAHARALLTSTPEGACDYIDADPRDTLTIVGEAARTLDLAKPVAVLLLAVLHLIPDTAGPAGIVARLASALAPGSYIAISHLTADFAPGPPTARAGNDTAPVPVIARTCAQVTSLFAGLPLLPPGVVPITAWRPDLNSRQQAADLYVGVTRTPAGRM